LISYRYLDNFLHPQRISLHRALLARLIPVWLLLSLLFGGATYWLEARQMEHFVTALAEQAVLRFQTGSSPSLLAQAPKQSPELGAMLRQTEFIGVRLYDAQRRLRLESWQSPDRALPPAVAQISHWFPAVGQNHYSSLALNGRIYVDSLVPLVESNGTVYGYFEGIYPIAPQTASAFASRIRDILFGVLISCALSSLALYPVMLSLNRDTVRLSHSLLASNVELMRVLGSAIAKRDSDTDSHNYRVTLYAVALAEALKRPAHEIIALMAGAFLHDVGKIGITDRILLKPGALDAEEFTVMKTHVAIGLEIISEVKWLELAQEVVACHHERFDGSGYPRGLVGAQIPFNARLFAIIDVFDALTSVRPYKQAFPYEQAMAIMHQQNGQHFDPELLSAFSGIAATLYHRYNQAETAQLRTRLARALEKYFRRAQVPL